MRAFWIIAATAASLAGLVSAALAQDRETKVRSDRTRVEASGFWIYNDLPRGFAEAKRTGKPLLVVLRCIPCEHCAMLDEKTVERDPSIQKLLEQFVCVRVVHANGMDLSLFQFDYDQSWAAFFLNADRTIYGRYGTRSHRTESDQDVSLAGFAAALRGALGLHRTLVRPQQDLAAKQGPPPEFPVPEAAPSLKGRYGAKLDYEGQVVRSCIHCHQVGEALRSHYRLSGRIPEHILFPYPNPRILGLQLDPQSRAKVSAVTPGSDAAKAGFRPGDEIETAGRQPILSTADLQWVLHRLHSGGTLEFQVKRAGTIRSLELELAPGWRRRDDISWRATTWELRRLVLGGMLLEEPAPADRARAGVGDGALLLLVKHVGQYSPHDRAKRAGVKAGDLLLAVDGDTRPRRETDLLATLLTERKPGDRVTYTFFSEGRRVDRTINVE